MAIQPCIQQIITCKKTIFYFHKIFLFANLQVINFTSWNKYQQKVPIRSELKDTIDSILKIYSLRRSEKICNDITLWQVIVQEEISIYIRCQHF